MGDQGSPDHLARLYSSKNRNWVLGVLIGFESKGKLSVDSLRKRMCWTHWPIRRMWARRLVTSHWRWRIQSILRKKAGLRGFIGDHELVLNRMKLLIRYKQLVSEIKHFLVPFVSKTEKIFCVDVPMSMMLSMYRNIKNDWYSKLDRSAFQLLTTRGWPVLGRNYCPWETDCLVEDLIRFWA